MTVTVEEDIIARLSPQQQVKMARMALRGFVFYYYGGARAPFWTIIEPDGERERFEHLSAALDAYRVGTEAIIAPWYNRKF